MGNASAPLVKTIELLSPFDFVLEYLVKSGKQIWQGVGVAIGSDGALVHASEAGALFTVGRADQSVLGDGTLTCRVRTGIFLMDNGVAALTVANRFGACYWEDDHTVGSANTTLFAGIVIDVTSDGVYVLMGPSVTSQQNVGAASKVYLTMRATDLVGGDATRYLTQSPVAGIITKVYATLCGHALTTGNATLTGKINGTGITNGVVTITQSGSAIGDKATASPTAARTVAVGDLLEFLVGGTNDNAAAFAELLIEITPNAS